MDRLYNLLFVYFNWESLGIPEGEEEVAKDQLPGLPLELSLNTTLSHASMIALGLGIMVAIISRENKKRK